MGSFDTSADLDELAGSITLSPQVVPQSKELSALEKFRRSILDQTRSYPPPESVINLVHGDEVYTLLSLKSYSLWQGKAKSKKTTVLAMAVAVVIGFAVNEGSIRFVAAKHGIVIVFDCEQGESYAARTMNLILKMGNVESSERLIYCDLRDFTPIERLEIINAAVENTPGLVMIVVDGVVDLMNNFMDAGEGMDTVTFLTRLSSRFNIHAAGVIHQNKGMSTDPRAHVGTISSQKAEMEIMAEVDSSDRSQSIISCKASRGLPFESFAIRWDKGDLPRIVQEGSFSLPAAPNKTPGKPTVKKPSDIDELTHRQILVNIFAGLDKPKISELYNRAGNVMDEMKYYASKNDIEKLISWYTMKGLIKKMGTPGTSAAYYALP